MEPTQDHKARAERFHAAAHGATESRYKNALEAIRRCSHPGECRWLLADAALTKGDSDAK